MLLNHIFFAFLLFIGTNCNLSTTDTGLIYQEGKTIQHRFLLPPGYKRIPAKENSFTAYLRNLNLHPHGTEVKLYNGETKNKKNVYCAVVNMNIGKKNLHQCADAVIHLRADYLYKQKLYDRIHFNFTSGFRADYLKWREGNKISVNNNHASWKPYSRELTTYQDFWEYLELVFTYAGTQSLSGELKQAKIENMMPGDVFIQGGSPGHAVIVVDMAVDTSSGKKIFLLAQSYMPAQEIQILINPKNPDISPWFHLDFGETLTTPEWEFKKGDLKRFAD